MLLFYLLIFNSCNYHELLLRFFTATRVHHHFRYSSSAIIDSDVTFSGSDTLLSTSICSFSCPTLQNEQVFVVTQGWTGFSDDAAGSISIVGGPSAIVTGDFYLPPLDKNNLVYFTGGKKTYRIFIPPVKF